MRTMLPMLCLLIGVGCGSAPPPAAAEPDPGRPVQVATAEEATATEAERLRSQAASSRAESDALVARRSAEDREARSEEIRKHQERTANRGTTPGRWNPSKGERPSGPVAPPPARQCRTVVATEVRGRPYTVRQADGSYTVGVEPVPVGVLPLEICDPVPGVSKVSPSP